MGFGPVTPEQDEPVFHARWEGRVRAMVMAMGGVIGANIDQGRFARENVPPLEYLSQSYYEIWYAGLVRQLLESGLVSAGELASGKAVMPSEPASRVLKAQDVTQVLTGTRPYSRTVEDQPKFSVGSRVRARNIHPVGHTRLPRYVRGHVGTIALLHDAHVFPDSNSAGHGEAPQWLYTVNFAARELWGDEADQTVTISVDAWESYLEPAE